MCPGHVAGGLVVQNRLDRIGAHAGLVCQAGPGPSQVMGADEDAGLRPDGGDLVPGLLQADDVLLQIGGMSQVGRLGLTFCQFLRGTQGGLALLEDLLHPQGDGQGVVGVILGVAHGQHLAAQIHVRPSQERGLPPPQAREKHQFEEMGGEKPVTALLGPGQVAHGR